VAKLERELLRLGEGAMLIEQLDGFVAGLLVCPELIQPAEWLPVIWDQYDNRQSPFDDVDHANRIFGLIMDHYNDIALTLMNDPERYGPLLPINEPSEEILWEVWIEGFVEAIRLRPEAWNRLLEADDDTSEAMLGMLALGEIVARNNELPSELVDTLTRTAPDLIPHWVVTLNKWRIANTTPPPVIAQSAMSSPPPFSGGRKVGRNEPCPCGSGKKYKRCCGLN
jgi:uncharacterized protein